VDILGLTIILPLLPFYAVSFGASATQVGSLVSTYAFFQLIAGPILGRMSDRAGRKPLLIVSQIGTFIGFLILAGAQSLWVVFLSRIIDGATAGNLSLAQAYIADVTEPQDRAKSFAVIGIAFGIGFLIGPGISGFLAQYGYVYPILTAAGLSFASILCTTFLLPNPIPHADAGSGPGGKRLGIFDWGTYLEYFRRPGLGRLLFQFLCFAFSFSMFISGFALYAKGRYTWNGKPYGPREVGYILAYAGFLGIILQGALMGRLVKWLGERKLVWTGFLASTAAYTMLGWTRTFSQLLGANTIGSYGSGVARPAITALVTHKADRSEQGVVLGLTQSLNSISQIVAPIAAGALIDRGWLAAWACATGAAAFIGFLISVGAE
jgi:MFS family permease